MTANDLKDQMEETPVEESLPQKEWLVLVGFAERRLPVSLTNPLIRVQHVDRREQALEAFRNRRRADHVIIKECYTAVGARDWADRAFQLQDAILRDARPCPPEFVERQGPVQVPFEYYHGHLGRRAKALV